jgi:hypothetical protein
MGRHLTITSWLLAMVLRCQNNGELSQRRVNKDTSVIGVIGAAAEQKVSCLRNFLCLVLGILHPCLLERWLGKK